MPDPKKKKKKGVSNAAIKKALALVKQGQKKKAIAKQKVSGVIRKRSQGKTKAESTRVARQRAIAKSDKEMIARKKKFLANKKKKKKNK